MSILLLNLCCLKYVDVASDLWILLYRHILVVSNDLFYLINYPYSKNRVLHLWIMSLEMFFANDDISLHKYYFFGSSRYLQLTLFWVLSLCCTLLIIQSCIEYISAINSILIYIIYTNDYYPNNQFKVGSRHRKYYLIYETQ